VTPDPADIPLMPSPAAPQLAPSPLVQPCPQAFTVQVASQTNGQAWVLVTFHGPCGSWSTFLDPPAAEKLAAQISEQALMARTGLVIPQGAVPAPNGHGPTIEHRP
jgi:hypothetical protein